MTDAPDAALLALLAVVAAGTPAAATAPPAIGRLEEARERLRALGVQLPAREGLRRVQFPNFGNFPNFQNAFPNFPNFPNFRNVRY